MTDEAIAALTFTLPSEEHRRRVRLAIVKEKDSLKKLREKNVAEEIDVSDIDHKLKIIDGDKNGTPGLIQIFSLQHELLGDQQKKGDPEQMDIEDAIAEGREREGGRRWADFVPEPRPKAGDRVRALEGGTILVIVDTLGYVMPEHADFPHGPQSADDHAKIVDDVGGGLFYADAVPIAKTDGFTEDDKERVWLDPLSVRDDNAEWTQVTPPARNLDSLREAARLGEATESETETETGSRTAVESDDEGPNVVKRRPRNRRTRAAAGNLAGAVKKVTKKAGSGRKR